MTLCKKLTRVQADMAEIAAKDMDECTYAESALFTLANDAIEHMMHSIHERNEERDKGS